MGKIPVGRWDRITMVGTGQDNVKALKHLAMIDMI
jgi:hypothetical protein